jgi:hypothetical protein
MALFLIDDPAAPWYWPPLPQGRRPRQLEHARRARLIREWRNRLVATLIQRLHVVSGFKRHGPPPEHPPRCVRQPLWINGKEQPAVCVFCEAIRVHRDGVELLLATDPRVPRRYFYP